MSKENSLVGKTVTSFWLAEDKKAIKFELSDGTSIKAFCDGDCCSSTWIEGIEAPEVVINSPILNAEDIDMPDLGSPEPYECIRYYGFRITTAKGICVIDYRNESNGYYGGDLSWPEDEYYYGGVYNQNLTTEVWKQLA